MNVPPIQTNKPQPTFGILKGTKPIQYGQYTWGEYKGYNISIIDYGKYEQKLIYVTDSQFHKWIKSKLIYIQNGIKQIMRSQAK